MPASVSLSNTYTQRGWKSKPISPRFLFHSYFLCTLSKSSSFEDRIFKFVEILKVMGISFKVSKSGRRFYPKTQPHGAASFTVDKEESSDSAIAVSKKISDGISLSNRKLGEVRENKGLAEITDNEVSFTLKLFPDGYSITKPVENESGNQASLDVPKSI